MASPRVVEKPSALLAYLFEMWPDTKKKTVRTWLKIGAVMVNGKVVTQFDRALKPGDTIAIRARGLAAPDTIVDGKIRIRHEDEDLIVIDKPAGMLSIASEAETLNTAYAHLTDHVRQGNRLSRARIWVVHRLDRETSGLMIFAKTEKAKHLLQQNWEKVEKKYLAVIEGALPKAEGRLESHLDESDPFKVRSTRPSQFTRAAATLYRVMKTDATCSLVELTLETGRRHQIRVQLADAGCPIVGDGRYGAKGDPIRRIALHASRLRFVHPGTNEEMRFESALPGDLGALIKVPSSL